MSFAHLHVHTQYSLLDGSNKISDYVNKVKELGMSAAAITDHGVMYGVIDFYREAKKAGINPVLGCELYVANGSRHDKENVEGEDRYYHLILLAENNTGYSNLMKIVSIGFVEGFYYKPRVDFETLEKYHEGLICLSACLAGEVPRLIQKGHFDEALECAKKYDKCFGHGNYFLELQDHGIAAQQTVNAALVRISKETDIPLVATNDCHYTNASDAAAHDILLCIQTGKTVSDENRMRYEGGQYFVKSEDEMKALFPYAPQAIENTAKIADRCHVDIEFGVTKLPHFDVPEGYDSYGYLKKLCDDGLIKRYGDDAHLHEEQLEYELNVIRKMGYVDYFLIVWDFINYARTHGIPVGPGRGSAAGSLVSYTMGITNIDPIRYSLLFERFLNPERVSMPDIDVDFCYERRSEVIKYVVEKYGSDCVTQIVTFGTLKAKGVIRDVGRVLEYPYQFADTIARSIPDERQGFPMTIDQALTTNHELKSRYDNEEDVKKIIDTARQLEGLPRQSSMHAAGVVISQKPMYEYVPLALAKDGSVVTQFTMTTIEELGLLKMDFLGLRTLTVIADTVRMVSDNHSVSIDIDKIDFDDPQVYKSIASGHDEGVFQLESQGMQSFMKELAPSNLEDIIAGISLYRPGPMDSIPDYIRAKNNPQSITYLCPQLEPILAPTYGCIVYQEQVMQIVRDLAGYSLGRSDLVRRAMSKKKISVMEEERRRFVYGDPEANVTGCIKNGIPEAIANKIFDDMVDFARYAFNKSHAASYAVVAYQTAWLKYYYPAEFFAALMTSVMDNTNKISAYIATCRNNNIPVLPPDINSGEGAFVAKDGKIRYGMYAIKSIGTGMIDAIVNERKANGEYRSIDDFLGRLNDGDINKRAIENLILSGAFDSLEGNRRQKIIAFPRLIDEKKREKKTSTPGQISLFEMVDSSDDEFRSKLPVAEEFDKAELLSREKDVIGIYISGHPLEDDIELMKKHADASASGFIQDEDSQLRLKDGQNVTVGGIIIEKRIHFTKKNEAMAFVTIEDLYGTIEILVFPKIYETYRALLMEDNKIFIRGRVSQEEERDSKLIASEIFSFDDAPKELWIRFSDSNDYALHKDRLYTLLRNSSGKDRVVLFLQSPKSVKRLSDRWNVKAEDDFVRILANDFGMENLIIKS